MNIPQNSLFTILLTEDEKRELEKVGAKIYVTLL